MPIKADIWMPLYIGDFLADTAHLDAQQSGAYLLLLMSYWRKGALPSDLDALMASAKLSGSSGQAILKKILAEFFTVENDGRWHQKRADAERLKWQGKRESAQKKAKAAANKRWLDASSNASSNASSSSPSNAQAMLGSCPLPSSLPGPLQRPLPKGFPGQPESIRKNDDFSSLNSFIHKMVPPPPLPKSKAEAMALNYTFSNSRPCRVCGAEAEWWTSPGGSPTPFLTSTGELHLGGCAASARKGNA